MRSLVEEFRLEEEKTSTSLHFAAKGTCPWTIHLAGGSPPGAGPSRGDWP